MDVDEKGETERHSIRLTQRLGNGSARFWNAIVEKQDEDRVVYTRIWGTVGGKPQTKVAVCTSGKQGRTPFQQAINMCNQAAVEKKRAGYVDHDAVEGDKTHNGEDASPPSPVDMKDVVSIQTTDAPPSLVPSNVPYPMLGHPVAKYPQLCTNNPNVGGHMMPKLDGVFAMAHLPTGRLWSRKRVKFTELMNLEDNVANLHREYMSRCGECSETLGSEWIVGELYLHGHSFQVINGAVRIGAADGRKRRSTTSLEIKDKLEFHVFDVTCKTLPFGIRYDRLKRFLFGGETRIGKIVLVDAQYAPSLHNAYKEYHDACVSDGYEGAMLHPEGDPGYQEDVRSKWLLKCKSFNDGEFECIEVIPQKQSSSQGRIAGSVLLRNAEGTEFRATPRYNEEQKQELWLNRDHYVGMYAIVRYFELTDDRKVPRFPILIGFRNALDM